MSLRWTVLASAIVLALVVVMPRLASAQVPAWDFSVSAFGGGAFPLETEIRGTDPTLSLDFKAREVEMRDSYSFGGKLGVWWTGLRGRIGLDLGAEVDATHFSPKVASQSGRLEGTSAGASFLTGTQINEIDVSSTIVAGNVLVRWPLDVSKELPQGRWHPYLGVGGGVQISEAEVGTVSDTDTAPVLQALAGLKIFLLPYIALFGEYKFTHAKHGFQLGTTKADLTFNVNHAVAGLAIHF